MTTPLSSGDQFNLGNAVGYVDINTSRAVAALQGFSSQFRGFFQQIGGGFQQVGQQITSFASGLGQAMAPFAAGMGVGIKTAANFQDALAEIEARTGATAEQMAMVRAEALRLGAETSFSAQQAADGMLMLLTAGLDTGQALAAIEPILIGAAAAGGDLGQTANQVTNIMSSFGLAASDATRIVEAMNKAAGASPAEMGDMGEALTLVGGDARNFGLSLEQTSAALAILARNGKVGSEAANQLKSIFTAMTADTADSNKAWDMVNSSLFDANGNARDFAVVLAEVKAGLENLNAEDQAFVIQSLAGSYGRVGFNALLASNGIEAVIEEMEGQADAATVAKKRLNTFNGRLEALRGSIETLLITAFTPFIEMLTPLLEQITGVVNQITTWIEANQALVQPVLKVLGTLITLVPVLFGVGKAFQLVGFLIGAVTSPINLVLLAITGLVAAFTSDFMGIRTALEPIIEAFGFAIQGLSSFTDIFSETGNVVTAIISSIASAIGNFAIAMGMPVEKANELRDSIQNALFRIQEAVGNLLAPFQNLHFYAQAALVIIHDTIMFQVLPAIRDFIQKNLEVIVVVGAGIAAFALAKVAAFALGVAFNVLQGAAKLLSGAFTFLTSPAVLLSGAIIGILLAANSLYPGGLVQMFKDATIAAQQLAFLGLGLLSAAATGASIVVNGFRQTMELLLPKIKEWFVDNSGMILGLGGLVIALLSASAHIKIFQAVLIAVRAVSAVASAIWGVMSGALTAIGVTSAGASAGIGAFAASMTAAIGPILAVAAAIAGVIRQIQIFNEQTGAVAIATQTEVASQAAAGQLTEQQLKDMIWQASLKQFNGNSLMAAILQPFLFNELAQDTQFAPPMARGTNFVPQNMLAWLHPGEAVVPREFNPAAGGVNNSGPQFHGPVYFEIKANSEAEGRAAARGFAAEFEELLRIT